MSEYTYWDEILNDNARLRADNARLREALTALGALTPGDSSEWLREHERRVAERVREACAKYLHVRTSGEFDFESMLAELDLDALLKEET